MSFLNLDNPPDPYPPFTFSNLSEKEKRLEIYRIQAWQYLLIHAEEVKGKYAQYILKRLCEQNSDLNALYYSKSKSDKEVNVMTSYYALQVIERYILLCDEMLVLCNLEKEPCVVVDAYVFTDYDIEAFEKQLLVEYIQNNPNREETSFYTDYTKKAATKTIQYTAGYGLDKMGTTLINTSGRLNKLSEHYASGHKTLMRTEKSIRGKKAQKEALIKLFGKSSEYGKSAAEKKIAGTLLSKLGSKLKKGPFKPVTVLDVFKVTNLADTSITGVNKNIAERYVLPELKKYCERNNNYRTIMNQQYFENADK